MNKSRRDREVENHRLIHENSHLKGMNDTLKGYISATYTKKSSLCKMASSFERTERQAAVIEPGYQDNLMAI